MNRQNWQTIIKRNLTKMKIFPIYEQVDETQMTDLEELQRKFVALTTETQRRRYAVMFQSFLNKRIFVLTLKRFRMD